MDAQVAARDREPTALEDEMTDGPIEEGATEATHDEKIRGIVAQVREDVRMGHADDEEGLLRQRLADAGIEVTDTQVRQYLD
jgi:predicted dehydrogenase